MSEIDPELLAEAAARASMDFFEELHKHKGMGGVGADPYDKGH